MPPQTPSYHHSPITPNTPLLYRVSSKMRLKQILLHQAGSGKMKLTKTKLIPLLVFILSGASIFRFLNITMITTSSPPLFPSLLNQIHQHAIPQTPKGLSESNLTETETQFLLKFLSDRVPCNLLIFGLEHQYSNITSVNRDGVTIFLQEDQDNLHNDPNTSKSTSNTQAYRIIYNTVASDAYQLLKIAREHPHCTPNSYHPKQSKCNLALSNLPQQVHDTEWDVVIVDGPDGSTPDSPGRMAAIYTASVLARRGQKTHVFVHDVHRMIERWFSWEFLCEENLVASKGRFWQFQILGVANATKFCTA